jgi:putative heme-binding domain-containing protein
MFGADPNPHVYGLMQSCADHIHWAGGHWTESRGAVGEHSDAGGGHAHSGCSVYLGDNFPAEYRNNVFMCNIHGNRLNRDKLERTPAGYVGKHAPDFLFANDSWFRGICVKCGPEGGLYVSDWCDTGECHNYDKADITNGRIYRVVYGTPKSWKGDISKLSDAELVKLQLHPNDWYVRHARRVLQERAAAGKLGKETTHQLRAILEGNPDATRQLRAAWAIHVTGGLAGSDINLMHKHPDPTVRGYAAVLALDTAEPSMVASELVSELGSDESVHVRRILAGQAARLSGYYHIAAVTRLLERPADPDTTLMFWYAIEPTIGAKQIERLAAFPHPRVTEFAVRKLLSARGSVPESLRECVAAITKARSDETRAAILRGIRDALAGATVTEVPAGWAAVYPDLAASGSAEVRDLVDDVGLIFHDPKALAVIRGRITDTAAAPAARRTAITRLASHKVAELAPTLRGLLADPAVRSAAIRALAAYPDADTPAAILKHYPGFTTAEKTDAVQTLASRPAFAAALLEAVEKGKIPRADVSVIAARQVLALNDRSLGDRLEKVWGTIRPASKERAALVKKWKGVLSTDALKTADTSRGRALFTQHCATCHRLFGEGTEFGPDLTGSQRANLDYVLENVLDPSAVVPREFRVTNFTLTDGRVVGGTVLRETPDGVTVRTTNETVVIATRDIESRKPTTQSIMPDGLFDKLKPEEVRDLVAYLASREQVPLPPTNTKQD